MDLDNPFFNTSTGTDKTKNALKIISKMAYTFLLQRLLEVFQINNVIHHM